MRPSQVLAFALAFTSLSSASLLDGSDFGLGLGGFEGLLRRQDEESPSATPAPKTTSQQSEEPKETKVETTASGDQPKETNKDSSQSDKPTPTGSGKSQSGGSKTTSKPKQTTFDARLPAGGISMLTPAALMGPQYYKIGDWVTFAWNYTSLSVTPTAIDILATATKNAATYTLAVNKTVEKTGYLLWDTKEFQASATVKLITDTYTLIVYDADSSISAAPKAGYLAAASGFTFGMYVPQAPTPLSEFTCPTCSNAAASAERQTLGFLLAMGTVTVLSFTWFANGFGAF